MQRTVRLPLTVSAEQEILLLDTSRQFVEAFNAVCEAGWTASEKNSVRLHHLTYRTLRERLPALPSNLLIQARVKAAEALTSAFARRQQKRKTSCPHSTACPPRYNERTFRLDWNTCTVSLSTTAGRAIASFALPAVFVWASEGKVCTADLIQRDGRFWLHVVVETPSPVVPETDAVLGVDLGLCHPAATSEGSFLGKRCWKEIEARLFRRKRGLQAKRTKSAQRRLRILRGKQARFRRDCDHVLSKRIVLGVEPGGTVVLENLTDIRKRCKATKRFNRRLHGWSFAQLKMFVGYKAEARGVRVAFIDPRHTSQTCSKCGHQHRSNRRSQSLFCCRECGFTLNADLNAARNIRAKHLVGLGTSSTDRPLSTGPTSRKAQGGGAKAATRKPPALAGGR